MRHLLKLLTFISVCIIAFGSSSYYVNAIVYEMQEKEKTIADVIIEQQVQDVLKEAEAKIEEVIEEEAIIIVQEEVAIKPAEEPIEFIEEIVEIPMEVPDVIEESEKREESTEMAEADGEEIEVAEEGEEVGLELATSDLETYQTLTEEDITYIAHYLIEHYFLFGENYYPNETDPVRYEKKKLANEMESYIIASLLELQSLTLNLTEIKASDLGAMTENAKMQAQTFKDSYQNVGEKEPVFQMIYEEGNRFFDVYIEGMTVATDVFNTLETSTNKLLALPVLLRRIDSELIPAIEGVLNQGFVFKEKTNAIYIEGIEGAYLLTPAEVVTIIENPYTILPHKENMEESHLEEVTTEE